MMMHTMPVMALPFLFLAAPRASIAMKRVVMRIKTPVMMPMTLVLTWSLKLLVAAITVSPAVALCLAARRFIVAPGPFEVPRFFPHHNHTTIVMNTRVTKLSPMWIGVDGDVAMLRFPWPMKSQVSVA